MADHLGQQFGNYTLTRLLGKGGFAEVYLGEHVFLKSQAAIKVLLTSLGEEEMAYFQNEARTLAALKHPHIVRILDFGIEGDIPFIVMEYAPNGTVQQRHPRGRPLAPEIILPYVKQVASALQYAHDQKLIHRDIKPGNMLLQDNNELLLSDFGVAIFAQSTRQQSRQEFVGTATYMAPEQIRGKACQASDQYALGVVVYEWLSGNYLFQGPFAEVCAQHMYAAPEPLHHKVPMLSPGIEQAVLTALAKDPSQRFASVEAFATALGEAIISAHPTIIDPLDAEHSDDQTVSSPTDATEAASFQTVAISPSPELTSQDETPVSQQLTKVIAEQENLFNAQAAPTPPLAVQGDATQPAITNITRLKSMLQTYRPRHLASPKGLLILFVLVALVLSGSGLLYYAYAGAGQSNAKQNHASASRQTGTQTIFTETTPGTTATVPSATSTTQQSLAIRPTSAPTLQPTSASNPDPTPTPNDSASNDPTPTPDNSTSGSAPASNPTPTPKPAPPKPTPTPKPVCPPLTVYGNKGTWVKTLQQDLNNRGMKDASGKKLVVDGDFGASTQYAVKSWQKHAKIQVDGEAGPETWHSLDRC